MKRKRAQYQLPGGLLLILWLSTVLTGQCKKSIEVWPNQDLQLAVSGYTRVLFVADDVSLNALAEQHVANILVDAGYEVMQARNSAEGEALVAENPDLVIVDYRMPGLDGVEWIKRLRSYGIRVPIVFCSGSGCDQGKFSVVRNLLQVSLIVQKPIKPTELLAQIERILPLEPKHIEAETQPVSLPNELTPDSGYPAHSDSDDFQEQGGCTEVAGDGDGMFESDSDSQSLDSLIRALNGEQADDAADIEGDLKSLVVEYARDLIDSVEQIRLDIVRGLELEPSLAMPAGEMAHRIAGTAGSLGLSDISHLAGKIEHLIFDNCEIADASRLPQQKAALVLALELAEQAAVVVDAYNNGGATAVEYSERQSGELSTPEVPAIGVYETDSSSVQAPVSQEPDRIDETPSVSVPWVASEVVRKLLVITTDFVLYRTIEQILEGERYYLVCADSRDSAIFELARLRPDVVLLDQATDFVGSGDLCGFIRKNVGVDVCLLTLLTSVASKRWALDAGFDDFLILPIEKEELLWRLGSPGRRSVGKSTENEHLDQQAC